MSNLAGLSSLDWRPAFTYEVCGTPISFELMIPQRQWKPRHYYMPIRVAISGKEKTPPLFHMIGALGRERALRRLEDGIHLLTD